MKLKSPQSSEIGKTSGVSRLFTQADVAELLQSISISNLPATLVSKEVIAAVISVNSCSTLKYYRKHYWTEGIHYFFLSPKKIIYNLELINDWAIHNRLNIQAHQRAIEAFLLRVKSNQSPRKQRRQTR